MLFHFDRAPSVPSVPSVLSVHTGSRLVGVPRSADHTQEDLKLMVKAADSVFSELAQGV